jgi:hypothetical protein
LLAAGLMLGLTAFFQSARANLVMLDDDFNDPNIRLAVNTNGIGGGFGFFALSGGFSRETNSFAQVGNTGNGAGRANIASQSGFPLGSGGTLFDFQNVKYTNTVVGGAPLTDRLILGVLATNVASDWFESAQAGIPGGFYIEPNSESIALGTASSLANSYWTNHTSCLFYKDPKAGTVTILTNWQFKTLAWNGGSGGGPGGYGTNYSPVLDIQLTLSATGWTLNITGDVNTNNQPISYSGTYAAAGIPINNNVFADGLHLCYVGTEVQSEGPCLQESVDRIVVTELGNPVVGCPQITTPQYLLPPYGYDTNAIFAGEILQLSSLVYDSSTTPTLQWQVSNASSPGTFTNLPNGNGTNVTVNTASFGDAQPRQFRLIANDGLNSATSALVSVTFNPPAAPVINRDISTSILSLYLGSGSTFTASFFGNQPIYYQWQFQGNGGSDIFTNIPGATNTSYSIISAKLSDAGFYQLTASNSIGGPVLSTSCYVTILTNTPKYLWSSLFPLYDITDHIIPHTAEQTLAGFPSTNKVAGALVAQNGGNGVTVTLTNAGNEQIVFAAMNAGWANVTGGTGWGTGASTNRTGNTPFNTCLNAKYTDGGSQTVIMSNLVVGRKYQVQLFGLDTALANASRQINWQDPVDPIDVSTTYAMGDNSYILGTFTASNTVETIRQNQLVSAGNFNCLVLWTVGWNPPPYFANQPRSSASYAGQNVSLTGRAAGDTTITNPTITYQWQAGPAGGPYTNLVEGVKYTGTTSNVLTVISLAANDAIPGYVLIASNGGGSTTSSVANIAIFAAPPQNLVGEWFNGAASLADQSGYTPGGIHDGYGVTGAGVLTNTYTFTNDVPPGATGVSLWLTNGNTAIAIANSATLDGSYTNTYDDGISNSFTVMCWAKGFPGSWNPWVSKYGETGAPAGGWQLRAYSGGPNTVFTMRGTGATDDPQGNIGTQTGNAWHHYTGTYDAVTGIRLLYVDGVVANTLTGNGKYTLSPITHLTIGGRDQPSGNNFTSYYNGEIYDVRIYTYPLSQSQIGTVAKLPPPLTRQVLPGAGGGKLVLTWTWGTLLEATNITGPWNVNTNVSPFTNNMTLPQDYFKARTP